MRAICLAAAALLAGCLDIGGKPQTGVYGRLTRGPGVVFLEEGKVQKGTFKRFGTIDEDGAFEVTLPAAGTWGVHLYLDGYLYIPLEVEVRDDFMTPIDQPDIAWGIIRSGPSWGVSGMQPADPYLLQPMVDTDMADNPVLTGPTVQMVGAQSVDGQRLWSASVDIADPNPDLSRQELLGNVETGVGLQLNPPGQPFCAERPDGTELCEIFPNGTYTARLYLPDSADPHGAWFFVAADHGCSNSVVTRVIPR